MKSGLYFFRLVILHSFLTINPLFHIDLLKASQLDAFCHLRNLKLFWIKVKELLEPLVLLKAFSEETDLLVTLGNFALKNVKLGREICKVKFHLVETKFAVQKIPTTIWLTCVQKNSQIPTLIKQSLAKYWFFKKLSQISLIYKSYNF